MNNPIRILLIDDHSLFRESLVRLLEAEPGFRIVAHCATVSEGSRILSSSAVDVILLDYDLGEEIGTNLLHELHARGHTAKVLMVTAGMRDSVAIDALQRGVAGIIFKHSGTGQLIEAIHKVAAGEMWLDSGAIRSLIAGSEQRTETEQAAHFLTGRQRKVLRGILNGLTNKEIASNLQVSETSIKSVIQELFHKAGVRTRSQLVRVAIEKYSADWLRDDSL